MELFLKTSLQCEQSDQSNCLFFDQFMNFCQSNCFEHAWWPNCQACLLYKQYLYLCQGISEFTWVVSPKADRAELCDFLNEHFVVTLINTTWECDEESLKAHVSKDIVNNLVHLPNINQMKDDEIRYTGDMLTKYCEGLSSETTYKKTLSNGGWRISSQEDT